MTNSDPVSMVEAALGRLVAEGKRVSFSAVAQEAGVARTTLYRNEALKALVDEHRLHQVDTQTLTGLHAEISHLRASVEAVAAKVRNQEERLRRLERKTH